MTAATVAATSGLGGVLADLHGREITAIGSEVVSLVGEARRALDHSDAAVDELTEAGLGFLVQVVAPLQRCLEQVDCDTESLAMHAHDWRRVADELEDTRHRLEVPGWTGRAAESFVSATGGFGTRVRQAVIACSGVSTLLQSSAALMSGARAMIVRIIDQVVDFMIAAEAAAEASARLTAGASEAVALSAILGEVAARVEEAITVVDRVGELLTRIGGALRNVSAVFADVDTQLVALAQLRPAASTTTAVTGGGAR